MATNGDRGGQPTGNAASATVGAAIAIAFMGSTLVTPLYVIYQHVFRFSQVTLTLIYAVYVVGNLTALLLLGRMSDRIGRRPITLAALAVACLSTLLFLFARGIASLFWARTVSGLAVGLVAGTCTAWLAELEADKSRAARIATSVNFVGLAVGSMLAGLLAELSPWPLQLPFIVYLFMLMGVAACVARTEETIARPRRLAEISLRPRIGIPAPIRARFIAPAVAAFNAMALVGFYAALIPSILVQSLHESNHAVAGAIVGELALLVAFAVILTRRMNSRSAMLWGLALLFPGLALVVGTQVFGSMSILLVGTAVSAASTALGYRGSLEVVNKIAPHERRAEVVSCYFVTAFIGNAVPVIGLGAIAGVTSLLIASCLFAALLAVLAAAGLFIETNTEFVTRKLRTREII